MVLCTPEVHWASRISCPMRRAISHRSQLLWKLKFMQPGSFAPVDEQRMMWKWRMGELPYVEWILNNISFHSNFPGHCLSFSRFSTACRYANKFWLYTYAYIYAKTSIIILEICLSNRCRNGLPNIRILNVITLWYLMPWEKQKK